MSRCNVIKVDEKLKQKSDSHLEESTKETDNNSLENNSADNGGYKRPVIVDPFIKLTKKMKYEFTGHNYLLVLFIEILDRIAWGDYTIKLSRRNIQVKKDEWHTSVSELCKLLNKNHRNIHHELAILEKMKVITISKPNARSILIKYTRGCFMSAEQATSIVPDIKKVKRRESCWQNDQHVNCDVGKTTNNLHERCGSNDQQSAIPSSLEKKVFKKEDYKNSDSQKNSIEEKNTGTKTLEDDLMSEDMHETNKNISPLKVMVLPKVDRRLAHLISEAMPSRLLKQDRVDMLQFAAGVYGEDEWPNLITLDKAAVMKDKLNWDTKLIAWLLKIDESEIS